MQNWDIEAIEDLKRIISEKRKQIENHKKEIAKLRSSVFYYEKKLKEKEAEERMKHGQIKRKD